MAADLTLVGHTHCGQIRIPWLYRAVIPTEGPFDGGWSETPAGELFITCGLGEVGLPMRFRTPPVVEVIEVR
jgi:predicted MPP superfamily phosphohydrolase